jgi:hypothetical protein
MTSAAHPENSTQAQTDFVYQYDQFEGMGEITNERT